MQVNNDQDDLNETIGVISNLIRTIDCDSVVWTGDINCDFLRKTRHTEIVIEALDNLNMTTTWKKFKIDFTCTYEREGVTYVSTLDHFLMDGELSMSVLDAGEIHHPENTSDHDAIFFVFDSIAVEQSSVHATPKIPKPSWRMASEEDKLQYTYKLDTKLNCIMVPTQISECTDLHCYRDNGGCPVSWGRVTSLPKG